MGESTYYHFQTKLTYPRYDQDFSPLLRSILLTVLKAWGQFQLHFCIPRTSPRILSPTAYNEHHLVNFPEYTFPATPYYVAPTWWNQNGPLAWVNWTRGKPLPGAEFGGNGVMWESIGAKRKDPEMQLKSEGRVRRQAEELMKNPWGYRAKVGFQAKPIVVDVHSGPGYGSPVNAYTKEDILGRKA